MIKSAMEVWNFALYDDIIAMTGLHHLLFIIFSSIRNGIFFPDRKILSIEFYFYLR